MSGELKREEIIAAIEKLKGESVHPQRLEDLKSMLKLWRQSQLAKWHKSWAHRVLYTAMFGPLLIVLFNLRRWGRVGIPSFSPWFIYLVPVSMVAFAWVYMKLRPISGGDKLGVYSKCVQCNYDLSGHDSVLGDEFWVGPAVCPECGQKYPAVGQ